MGRREDLHAPKAALPAVAAIHIRIDRTDHPVPGPLGKQLWLVFPGGNRWPVFYPCLEAFSTARRPKIARLLLHFAVETPAGGMRPPGRIFYRSALRQNHTPACSDPAGERVAGSGGARTVDAEVDLR